MSVNDRVKELVAAAHREPLCKDQVMDIDWSAAENAVAMFSKELNKKELSELNLFELRDAAEEGFEDLGINPEVELGRSCDQLSKWKFMFTEVMTKKIFLEDMLKCNTTNQLELSTDGMVDLEVQMAHAKEAVKKSKQTCASIREELDSMIDQVTTSHNNYISIQQHIEDVLDGIRAQIEAASGDKAVSLEEIRNTISYYSEVLDKIRNTIQTLDKQKTHIDDEMATLEFERDAMRLETEGLRVDVASSQDAVETKKAENTVHARLQNFQEFYGVALHTLHSLSGVKTSLQDLTPGQSTFDLRVEILVLPNEKPFTVLFTFDNTTKAPHPRVVRAKVLEMAAGKSPTSKLLRDIYVQDLIRSVVSGGDLQAFICELRQRVHNRMALWKELDSLPTGFDVMIDEKKNMYDFVLPSGAKYSTAIDGDYPQDHGHVYLTGSDRPIENAGIHSNPGEGIATFLLRLDSMMTAATMDTTEA
eukprot:Rmarinus@m.4687